MASVELDGKAVRTVEIPLKDDGATHRIVVTMGEKPRKASGNSAAAEPAESKME